MKRLIALLVAALVATACSGAPEVYEVPPGRASGARLADLELPEPVPAVPAYTLHARAGFTARQLERLAGVDGARVVSAVRLKRVAVAGRPRRVLVGAVDPIEFRSVAPPGTRDATFVWLSLLGGEAVLTSKAARSLGARRPVFLQLAKDKVRVGAIAENGIPSFADAIVDARVAGDWGAPDVVVVGAASGVTLEVLGKDLRRAVRSARVKRIDLTDQKYTPPAPQTVIVATAAVPVSSVTGLHPTLQEAVGRLISASGGRVWLVSGFRDHQRQWQLWIAALQRYGDPETADNWVAPPGSSMHERGLAVDLGGDLALAARLVNELGLPLWRPMSWEPWHFELAGSRG